MHYRLFFLPVSLLLVFVKIWMVSISIFNESPWTVTCTVYHVFQNQFLSFCIFLSCQDAQQERSTFVSSLLPLLAEYSLQPPVADAQSIVSNVKVSFDMFPLKLSDAATLV